MRTAMNCRARGGADFRAPHPPPSPALRSPASLRRAEQSTLHRRSAAPRGGFTLLELMVVMFVMLLIAGLAVASMRQFLETERIRLAGGTVDSAIRMARQYAMSKRTQCMVEFVSPARSGSGLVMDVFPAHMTFVRGGSYATTNQGAGLIMVKDDSSNDYDRRGLLQYDLSALNVPDATVTVTSAILHLSASSAGATGFSFAVKSVANDAWDQASVTWNTQPAAGGGIGSFGVTSVSVATYDVDVTAYVAAELAGDKKASLNLEGTVVGSDKWVNISAASLEVTYDAIMSTMAEADDLVPRQVKIIPYRRWLNRSTGGFTWLLEQDVNALKTMDLPRNIHFALAPSKASIPQYDPADLDKSTNASKVFFVLKPDGTCSAAAPDVEDDPFGTKDHWKNFTNAVILRDLANDDLCLMYTPPATAFTRTRYVYGGADVDAFVAAHAPYVLW